MNKNSCYAPVFALIVLCVSQRRSLYFNNTLAKSIRKVPYWKEASTKKRHTRQQADARTFSHETQPSSQSLSAFGSIAVCTMIILIQTLTTMSELRKSGLFTRRKSVCILVRCMHLRCWRVKISSRIFHSNVMHATAVIREFSSNHILHSYSTRKSIEWYFGREHVLQIEVTCAGCMKTPQTYFNSRHIFHQSHTTGALLCVPR